MASLPHGLVPIADVLARLRRDQDPDAATIYPPDDLLNAADFLEGEFAPVQPVERPRAGTEQTLHDFDSSTPYCDGCDEPIPDCTCRGSVERPRDAEAVERARDAVHDFELASEPTGYGPLARRRYDEARDELGAAVAALGPVERPEERLAASRVAGQIGRIGDWIDRDRPGCAGGDDGAE